MTPFRLTTPSRLHFGLLSWGKAEGRRFGGVGMMVERPGLILTADAADDWGAEGVLARRALTTARRVAAHLETLGHPPRPLRLTFESTPPEHAGLGTGTQLSLAVARCVALSAGLSTEEAPASLLAAWTGRGLRSGVGLHGFERGGLIVDGGHRPDTEGEVPPLLCRHSVPRDWSVLVVIPNLPAGLFGDEEVRAFASLPSFSDTLIDRLCRLVLLDLLPAAVEGDLETFGLALEELQARVGSAFAPAQGGPYAHPALDEVVSWLRRAGLHGVGQSSWGPALYGFIPSDADREAAIRDRLHARFDIPAASLFWTKTDLFGSRITKDRVVRTDPLGPR